MAEFARGGIVHCPPRLGDSLPIPVMRGCMVAPAFMVKQYGAEFLAALNGSADAEVIAVHE